MARVAVALGSNLGDRHHILHATADRLAEILTEIHLSPFYETAPAGVGPQPDFLNAAAVGSCEMPPRPLLAHLLALEQAFGRTRPFPGAPRTLDLDLILYGDLMLDEPDLIVPHPRFRDRWFVLRPLADVAPDMTDPVTGATVRELLARVKR